MKPISVQLYTMREQMKDGNHLSILKKVADFGYAGVEPAGFYGLSAAEFRKVVEDLGMTISSNHGPLPNKGNAAEIKEMYAGLGTKWVVSGFGPDDFATHEAVEETVKKANEAVEVLDGTGLTFVLHNHWWEFEPLDSKLAYDWLLSKCPGVRLEIDTYWASNFGANDVPAEVAKRKSLTPLLHIKDGPLVKGEPHVAVGSGKMDIPAVIEAADPNVLEWIVVELDACATDMVQAVEDSYNYLVGNELASGRK